MGKQTSACCLLCQKRTRCFSLVLTLAAICSVPVLKRLALITVLLIATVPVTLHHTSCPSYPFHRKAKNKQTNKYPPKPKRKQTKKTLTFRRKVFQGTNFHAEELGCVQASPVPRPVLFNCCTMSLTNSTK